MAHFARLDENNVVLEVLLVDNDHLIDENIVEREELGVAFLKNLFGEDRTWIQTSYNHNFRKRFAGPLSVYIPETDIFAEPQPYPSWTYNIEDDKWESPVSYPTDGGYYVWNEDGQSWDLA